MEQENERLQRENERLKRELDALNSQLRGQNGLAAPAAAAGPLPDGSGSSSEDAAHAAFHSDHGLSRARVERYSRQLLLPSFGVAAQARLCHGRVLIVGCGGLGSPAALYLAAAGVGTLGLVDHDVVELSNMHRQVIHTEGRLGHHKAASAAAAVTALNSSVGVQLHLGGLTQANALGIVSQYDVVIDASDNPPTRYLLNDACVASGRPLVSGAAVGTDGQLTVYHHGPDGPCYRCLFPECPAAATCSRCADAGVLGPVPGVIGVLQATEAIKLLAGVGQVLAGRLLLYDALAGRFTSIKLRTRAPACAACGSDPAITRDTIATYDYAAFTGGQTANDGPPPPLDVLPAAQRLTPRQLKQRLDAAACAAAAVPPAAVAADPAGTGAQQQQQPEQQQEPPLLLDVRPPEQFAVMALPGAVNVPFTKLEQRLPELLRMCGGGADQQQGPGAAAGGAAAGAQRQPRPVYVVCRRGNHSQLAVQRLREAGVAQAVDLVGGYEAWAAEVDPGMPTL